MKTRIVANGAERLLQARNEQRRKLKKSLRAQHADELAKMNFWQRLRLRRRIAVEVNRELQKTEPSPYALYVGGITAGAQEKLKKRIMNKIISLLLISAALAFAGCKQPKEGANYQDVSANDAAMNAAIAKARATSADFVAAFHAQKTGTHEFSVKKPYPTPSGSEEHMWIDVTDETGGVLKGIVANEAEETRAVTNGQKVTLNISEISDWKYIDGKKLVGGYTIRYFLERASPKERDAILKDGGFEL